VVGLNSGLTAGMLHVSDWKMAQAWKFDFFAQEEHPSRPAIPNTSGAALVPDLPFLASVSELKKTSAGIGDQRSIVPYT